MKTRVCILLVLLVITLPVIGSGLDEALNVLKQSALNVDGKIE